MHHEISRDRRIFSVIGVDGVIKLVVIVVIVLLTFLLKYMRYSYNNMCASYFFVHIFSSAKILKFEGSGE